MLGQLRWGVAAAEDRVQPIPRAHHRHHQVKSRHTHTDSHIHTQTYIHKAHTASSRPPCINHHGGRLSKHSCSSSLETPSEWPLTLPPPSLLPWQLHHRAAEVVQGPHLHTGSGGVAGRQAPGHMGQVRPGTTSTCNFNTQLQVIAEHCNFSRREHFNTESETQTCRGNLNITKLPLCNENFKSNQLGTRGGVPCDSLLIPASIYVCVYVCWLGGGSGLGHEGL